MVPMLLCKVLLLRQATAPWLALACLQVKEEASEDGEDGIGPSIPITALQGKEQAVVDVVDEK
jgi:hypothetical protein